MTSDNALMIAKVALLTKELTLARIELKRKDQIIERAEKALNNYAIADDVGAIARRYFQDKDKE